MSGQWRPCDLFRVAVLIIAAIFGFIGISLQFAFFSQIFEIRWRERELYLENPIIIEFPDRWSAEYTMISYKISELGGEDINEWSRHSFSDIVSKVGGSIERGRMEVNIDEKTGGIVREPFDNDWKYLQRIEKKRVSEAPVTITYTIKENSNPSICSAKYIGGQFSLFSNWISSVPSTSISTRKIDWSPSTDSVNSSCTLYTKTSASGLYSGGLCIRLPLSIEEELENYQKGTAPDAMKTAGKVRKSSAIIYEIYTSLGDEAQLYQLSSFTPLTDQPFDPKLFSVPNNCS